MPELRDHACECDRRSCRERVYLVVRDYREAAKRGRVVALEHVYPGEQIERHRTYAIVTQDRARPHCASRALVEREPRAAFLVGRSSSVVVASATRPSRSTSPTLIPGGTRV